MAQSYVDVDYSRYPFICIKYKPIDPTVEEFDNYLNDMVDIYNNYQNFILIFDATQTKYLSGELRARQSEWIKANDSKIKANCKGMVYILPNLMIEVLFKCIISFSPLPVKYATSRTKEGAFAEAEKMMQKVSSK